MTVKPWWSGSSLRLGINRPGQEQQLNFVRVLASIVDGMEGSGGFSARSRVVALMGRQLSVLGDVDAETVLAVLTPLNTNLTRLEVFASVAGGEDQTGNDGPPWVGSVADKLADEAVDEVTANLRLGDAAPDGTGILYSVHFLRTRGRAGELRDVIAELLNAGDVDVPGVAARFVSMRMYSGKTTWELSPEVYQQLYNQIVPPTDDPFYSEPPQRVDLDDLSWPNRRRLAAGRFTRPSATEEPPEN